MRAPQGALLPLLRLWQRCGPPRLQACTAAFQTLKGLEACELAACFPVLRGRCLLRYLERMSWSGVGATNAPR